MQGRVVRTVSNYYHVADNGKVIVCKPRGRLKREGLSVLTGDLVEYTLFPDGSGVIESVLPRRSVLVRPPVANVTQAIIVYTVREPGLNLELTDRIAVQAEYAGLSCVFCLNKIDLLKPGECTLAVEHYTKAGYDVIMTSALTGEGIDRLKQRLTGEVSVLAGQSGVGKSRLLTAFRPGLELKTGGLSRKTGRGRHTTRHVELLEVASGLVADSPGFSRLDLDEIPRASLMYCFPEIAARSGACRFRGCTHRLEPGCEVRNLVEHGVIGCARYEHYVRFFEEIVEAESRRY